MELVVQDVEERCVEAGGHVVHETVHLDLELARQVALLDRHTPLVAQRDGGSSDAIVGRAAGCVHRSGEVRIEKEGGAWGTRSRVPQGCPHSYVERRSSLTNHPLLSM